MDTILRIDVGAAGEPKVTTESLGDYAGLGGRGLTSAIIATEVPADAHPLGPENKVVIAPGLLSGTAAAMSGRLSVGCKSPLTGGIKEANSGGQAAQLLARLGYAAIVLEGARRNDTWYVVRINSEGVTVTADDSVRGATNYQLMDRFLGEYEKKGAMISIGTAGEFGYANSTVSITDIEGRPTRHAGRGGAGAVMGSKGIKAILVDGEGTKVRVPANPDAFKAASKAWSAGLASHPVTGEGLPAYGTNVLTNVINEAGGFPTRNFATGQFEGASKISGETQAEMEIERGGSATHGCHRGCTIQCSGTFVDKEGNYVTKQPEYETVWAHGADCGIDDLDVIAQLDRLDDDYGLDTIEMGATIAVAMEAGVAPFGDGKAAIDLLHQVGKGTPLGPHSRLGRGHHGPRVRHRARALRQGPGDARLRSARHQGNRRHLRDLDHGGGPHGRVRGGDQHSQGRRRRGPVEGGRPGRAFAEPADRHGRSRRHGHVPVRRLRRARSAGNLPGPGRPAERLLRLESRRRRGHVLRPADPGLRARLQRTGGLHEGR